MFSIYATTSTLFHTNFFKHFYLYYYYNKQQQQPSELSNRIIQYQ